MRVKQCGTKRISKIVIWYEIKEMHCLLHMKVKRKNSFLNGKWTYQQLVHEQNLHIEQPLVLVVHQSKSCLLFHCFSEPPSQVDPTDCFVNFETELQMRVGSDDLDVWLWRCHLAKGSIQLCIQQIRTFNHAGEKRRIYGQIQ